MRQTQVNMLPKVAVGKGGRLAKPLINATGRPLHFSYKGRGEIIPPNPKIEYLDPKYRHCLGLSVKTDGPKTDSRLTQAQETIVILRQQLVEAQTRNKELSEHLEALDAVVTQKVEKVWTQAQLQELGKAEVINIAQEFDPNVIIGTKNALIEFILSWQKEAGLGATPADNLSQNDSVTGSDK